MRRHVFTLTAGVLSVADLDIGGSNSGIGASSNAAANLDQGSNGEPGDPAIDRTPVDWVNGNLNPQDTHFAEGMSIPYRMVMTNLTNGTHNLVIGWDTRDGSLAALDYLTHYQRLEPHSQFLPPHAAEVVQPLDDLTGPFAGPSTFAIPVPANGGSQVPNMPTNSFNALPGAERLMTIWNGTINSLTYTDQDSLDLAHSQSELTINFTSTSPTVVISWGGHIARQDEWNGAAHPTGSPYHMRNIELDGQGGNQDRVLLALPQCRLAKLDHDIEWEGGVGDAEAIQFPRVDRHDGVAGGRRREIARHHSRRGVGEVLPVAGEIHHDTA